MPLSVGPANSYRSGLSHGSDQNPLESISQAMSSLTRAVVQVQAQVERASAAQNEQIQTLAARQARASASTSGLDAVMIERHRRIEEHIKTSCFGSKTLSLEKPSLAEIFVGISK